MCPTLDAFNTLGHLVCSPPLMINETILTLEHVMERLDAIEKKMLTIEHIENLDIKMQSYTTKVGSKAGEIFKLLKEKGNTTHERIKQSPSRLDKLDEFFLVLVQLFLPLKLP